MSGSSQSTNGKIRIAIILSTYALRLAGQGVAFFLFARALGAENFGYIVAALAVLSPISPFVDMGAYSIVSRDIALGRDPLLVIDENLTTMLFTFPAGLLLAVIFAHIANPGTNLVVLLMIGIAYLSLSRTSLLLAAIQNTMNHRIPVIFIEAVSAVLLVLLGIYGIVCGYTLFQWAFAYFIIGICVLFLSLLMIRKYVGKFSLKHWPNVKRIKEGLTFSTGNSFQYVYTDIDKVVLLRFATADLTGVYGMTTRIGSVFLIPIGAVYSLFYPRFIRSGHNLDIPIEKLLVRVLAISAAYSAATFIGVSVISNLIPRFLGEDYLDVPGLLKVLVISVIFQIFQTPFADAITGFGYQIYRTAIQGSACVIALLSTLVLIPGNPKYGVLHANLIVHGFLLLAYITAYLYLRKTKISMINVRIENLV